MGRREGVCILCGFVPFKSLWMEWPFVFRGQLFGEKKKKLKVARLHKNAISTNTEEDEEVSQAVVGLVGMGRWMNKWMALEEGWLWVTGSSTNWINKWNNVQWINCSLSLYFLSWLSHHHHYASSSFPNFSNPKDWLKQCMKNFSLF